MIKITFLQSLKTLFTLVALVLISTVNYAQNLTFNFTDNTVDNQDIAQTIVVDGDSFELTVTHTENIDVDAFGNGDSIFFTEFGFPSTDPYVISLTRNGEPVAFTLFGLEYDALIGTELSLANQDGDLITDNVSINPVYGTLPIENVENATEISAFEIRTEDSAAFENIGFTNISVEALGTLSVDDNAIQLLGVYPNPSNGLFTIDRGTTTIESIQISDLNGRIISTIDTAGGLQNETIDMRSTLAQGIYLVAFTSSSSTLVRRIIIN
jgi:hypothetical protein